MKRRVVITGLGVVAPNGIGISQFTNALKSGLSGVRFIEELERLQFACTIGGIPPPIVTDHPFLPKMITAKNIMYSYLAAKEAWDNAHLTIKDKNEDPDWDTGCIFGSGMADLLVIKEAMDKTDSGNVRRVGSTVVNQAMPSSASAHLSGLLGLGNISTSNASACSTGTQSLILAYERIIAGHAKRILAGSCEAYNRYNWAVFDTMRILSKKYNHSPEQACRPMSQDACGLVPGAGAAALVVEDLDTALERGAPIYAEILGGSSNSGGHRNGGSITAPNPKGIIRCIQGAVHNSHIDSKDIDAISGHLTATLADPSEIKGWSIALKRKGKYFPFINSTKSMIGHCLSASGSIESIAAILQLKENFLHPSINCQDIHSGILETISSDCVVRETMTNIKLDTIAKASFGFGDVNSCIIFKKYSNSI